MPRLCSLTLALPELEATLLLSIVLAFVHLHALAILRIFGLAELKARALAATG